jgi:hypothetical protein
VSIDWASLRSASVGCVANPSSATDPTATDPTATDPTATDPTATDPTATDPTATDPTATRPRRRLRNAARETRRSPTRPPERDG